MSKSKVSARQQEVRRLLRDPLLLAPADAAGWILLGVFTTTLLFAAWWVWGLLTAIPEAIPESFTAAVDPSKCAVVEGQGGGQLGKDGKFRSTACRSATVLSNSWNRQVDALKKLANTAKKETGISSRNMSSDPDIDKF